MRCRARPALDGERGFTLVEMIVALVVLGLILGLLGSGARLLRGTGERMAERSAALGDVVLASSLLQERLGDAVLLEFGDPGRPLVASFDGTEIGVRFATLSLPVGPRPPVLAMEISQAAEGGIRLVVAALAPNATDFSALDGGGGAEVRALLRGAGDLRLDYFGRKAGARAAEWHQSWRDEPTLPQAVRLAFDHARFDLPPLIVPIRQTAASLCASEVAMMTCGGGGEP